MRVASGTIASLVLTFGALLLFVAVNSSNNVINNGRRPPKNSFLRSSTRRKLDNYSKSRSATSSYNYSTSNGENYDSSTSSAYMNQKYANGDGTYGSVYGSTDDASQQQNSNNYGNNYANYADNSGYNNNNGNYQNQDYDNSYYIWQNDDANAYYNGRDQSYGGQNVQTYSDDEEPEVYEEGYEEEDARWGVLGQLGGLTAKETVAVASLAVVVSVSLLFLILLASGCNIIDLCQLYCCCGIFDHTDVTSSLSEATEDGFVKLG